MVTRPGSRSRGGGPPTLRAVTPVDDEARQRRIRRGVGFGIPTVVCSALVLALGLPWWLVGIFLMFFGLLIITSS